MNEKMYNLCKSPGAAFMELAHSTTEELQRLFDEVMFVVAAVGNAE